MARRQVAVDEGRQVELEVRVPAKHVGQGLGDQVVLGPEMAVEAAVREAGGVHHLRDGDRIKALAPKQPAGCVQDPSPMLGPLRSTDLHRCVLAVDGWGHDGHTITIMMTVITHKQITQEDDDEHSTGTGDGGGRS